MPNGEFNHLQSVSIKVWDDAQQKHVTPSALGGSVTNSVTSETRYTATAAGTGYSIGDSITKIDIISPTTGAVTATSWINTTTGTTLATAPNLADLSQPTSESEVTISDNAIRTAVDTTQAANQDDGTLNIAANSNRKYYRIQNLSPFVIYVRLTGNATTTFYDSILLPGDMEQENHTGQINYFIDSTSTPDISSVPAELQKSRLIITEFTV